MDGSEPGDQSSGLNSTSGHIKNGESLYDVMGSAWDRLDLDLVPDRHTKHVEATTLPTQRLKLKSMMFEYLTDDLGNLSNSSSSPGNSNCETAANDDLPRWYWHKRWESCGGSSDYLQLVKDLISKEYTKLKRYQASIVGDYEKFETETGYEITACLHINCKTNTRIFDPFTKSFMDESGNVHFKRTRQEACDSSTDAESLPSNKKPRLDDDNGVAVMKKEDKNNNTNNLVRNLAIYDKPMAGRDINEIEDWISRVEPTAAPTRSIDSTPELSKPEEKPSSQPPANLAYPYERQILFLRESVLDRLNQIQALLCEAVTHETCLEDLEAKLDKPESPQQEQKTAQEAHGRTLSDLETQIAWHTSMVDYLLSSLHLATESRNAAYANADADSPHDSKHSLQPNVTVLSHSMRRMNRALDHKSWNILEDEEVVAACHAAQGHGRGASDEKIDDDVAMNM